MLQLDHVAAGYGRVQVLRDISLTVPAGQVTCVMGRNGAGKTTLLRTIMGLVPAWAGTITLDGMPLHRLPAHEVARFGIGYVPQGRGLFGDLTVAENLTIGLRARGRGAETRAAVLARFPRLAERLDQPATTLSGGEQQMLAMARALCLDPGVLLLDEPSEGLQPAMVARIADVVRDLRQAGVAILLVEQRVETALSLADRIAFVSGGTVAAEYPAAELDPGNAAFARHVGV